MANPKTPAASNRRNASNFQPPPSSPVPRFPLFAGVAPKPGLGVIGERGDLRRPADGAVTDRRADDAPVPRRGAACRLSSNFGEDASADIPTARLGTVTDCPQFGQSDS